LQKFVRASAPVALRRVGYDKFHLGSAVSPLCFFTIKMGALPLLKTASTQINLQHRGVLQEAHTPF
jgi:hypothetical protein